MNIMNHAQRSNGKLSQAAINTFASIAQSIDHHATLSQWDRANSHMRTALLKAKSDSSNSKTFMKNAKLETGILRNTHPLLQWCVQNWY